MWSSALVVLLTLSLVACGVRPMAGGSFTTGAALPAVAKNHGRVPSFYTDPVVKPDALSPPGRMIRAEVLPEDFTPESAGRAMRMLYSSKNGLDGVSRVVVSGAVFLPKGDRPVGGWPIIAWEHGTVGSADVCAPSLTKRPGLPAAYLDHWLDKGYAVVASDYQGLGVPGGHPYLNAKAEAFSTLDGVRAALDANLGLGNKTILVGHSQGAQAAFATAVESASYAPELDVVGTVLTGAPYFTPQIMSAMFSGPHTDTQVVYGLLLLQSLQLADPSFRPEDVLSDSARPLFALSRTECFDDLAGAVATSRISSGQAFLTDAIVAAFERHAGMFEYPGLRSSAPVFIAIGEHDADVPLSMQEQLFLDACAAGSKIEIRRYAGAGHGEVAQAALLDALPFTSELLAGRPVADDCPSRG